MSQLARRPGSNDAPVVRNDVKLDEEFGIVALLLPNKVRRYQDLNSLIGQWFNFSISPQAWEQRCSTMVNNDRNNDRNNDSLKVERPASMCIMSTLGYVIFFSTLTDLQTCELTLIDTVCPKNLNRAPNQSQQGFDVSHVR